MEITASIKRTDHRFGQCTCQRDVNGSRMNGFMPHKVLDGQKIRTLLIKMCRIGMTECVTGETMLPSKAFFCFANL